MALGDASCVAAEVLGRQPGGVGRAAARARCLAVVNDFFEWRGPGAVDAGALEVLATRQRELPKVLDARERDAA